MVFQESEILKNAVSERWCADSSIIFPDQRTIGPENAHLKPDLGVLSHNEMTLTLNTHTPLLTL